ncbi:MAG: cyclic nucleotide-binding domain-containing protein [Desulfuromonadaceae bacterium]|nr:cyclic nucleotide-binding domain-containing protein [Desulfuromonadaceae bacterium]
MRTNHATVAEKLELLKNAPVCSGLNLDEIGEIASHMILCEADSDEVICEQGDTGDFLYVVCHGAIDVMREEDGTKKIIAGILPGNLLGEIAFIDGTKRSASAVAKTNVTLLQMSQHDYLDLMRLNPLLWGSLNLRIAREVCKRLRKTSKILAQYLDY